MNDAGDGGGQRSIRVLGWITLGAGIALIVLKLADGQGFSLGGAGAVLLGTVMVLRPGRMSAG